MFVSSHAPNHPNQGWEKLACSNLTEHAAVFIFRIFGKF